MAEEIAFGPFKLLAHKRLLLRDKEPVLLGARAFDILVVLAARPNTIIGKADLLAQVWPDASVEEGSLRFHISNLRKALGDGKNGARYITTVSGRGYCLVASSLPPTSPDALSSTPTSLPNVTGPVVGRSHDIADISTQLMHARFVTIVGMGGVGKTTLAVCLGHELTSTFTGNIHFVDLGAVSDADLVESTVASMLGVSGMSADALANIVAYLANQRSLLILDTCERVIDAAAALASRIFAATQHTYILATSREALNVEGEQVVRLKPLTCPPDDPALTGSAVQDFPAVQLFVQRVAASGIQVRLNDADAKVVGEICRRLDGVPLAIELAAGRVASFGLQATANLLNERLGLSWVGQRSAPQRQKTLQATLEWSFQLLSPLEQKTLVRLAVFVGTFSLDAALAVVTDSNIRPPHLLEALDNLVAKSMLQAYASDKEMHYQLLDTTRAFALQVENLKQDERVELATRHASFYLRWLEEAGSEWSIRSSSSQRSSRLADLANVRAAIEWCFGSDGDTQVGIQLVVAARPMFLSMSLLMECHYWTVAALQVLDDVDPGDRRQMHLQAALGVSLMFTHGGQNAARTALEKSLAVAEIKGNALDQIQVLAPLQMFCLRTGDFQAALRHAMRCSELALSLGDLASVNLAHSLVGISLHLNGKHEQARTALEFALRLDPSSESSTIGYLGFDGRLLAGAILARVLWLQGYYDDAAQRSIVTINEAEALNHPLTLCITLVWGISVFLWIGDHARAEQYIERLLSCATSHSLAPYVAVGRGFRGELTMRRGDPEKALEDLRYSLVTLHKAPYELLSTPLGIALAECLGLTGRVIEALALLDEIKDAVEANGDFCYLPELLRVKGNLVRARNRSMETTAEMYFLESLEVSRRHGAQAWELRTTIDLAREIIAQNQHNRARDVLDTFIQDIKPVSGNEKYLEVSRLLEALNGHAGME